MVKIDAMVMAQRPMRIAGVVLALMLGVTGCEQAPESTVETQTRSPVVPADPGSVEVVSEAEVPASADNSQTMSAEEASRHFKVRTTDTAEAAVQAVEAAGRKTEQTVDEATP